MHWRDEARQEVRLRCNGALGNLDEDVDRLADAMAYPDRTADDDAAATLARSRAATLAAR